MKLFNAKYTNEAFEQLKDLNLNNREKILKAINLFEYMGVHAKNSRDLGNNGLFEIKADKIRAYFKYEKNRIITIGFIVLKKTQKAPKRYIKQAISNIEISRQKNKEL
ncbi:MAG: type II toxin-antitoxin system RelE/ParE family toxin [Candidatus Gastranaerophilaceae bacterium]